MWNKRLYTKKYMKREDRTKESMFLEDEPTCYDLEWDPFKVDISKWTSENIEQYLASNPKLLPSIIEIKKAQKNPYGGNPYMLCLFECDSKKIELWISSTILHNLYSVMFNTFVSQNLIFNYCAL